MTKVCVWITDVMTQRASIEISVHMMQSFHEFRGGALHLMAVELSSLCNASPGHVSVHMMQSVREL